MRGLSLAAAVLIPALWAGLTALTAAADQRPQPVIEGVTPSNARAGGPDFILRVRGRGFGPASVVRWNGAERVTAELAPDTLTAMIPASDIAREGRAHLTVFDPLGGLSQAYMMEVRSGGDDSSSTQRRPNPVPAVVAFEPASGEAGARRLRLKVRGFGFTPLSVVRFRGAPRHTRFLSSTTLSADLLAADLRFPGEVPITVRNPLPGGGVSRPVPLPIEATAGLSPDKPRVHPNPWRADVDEGRRIAFDNLAAKSRITIYTVKGAWIKTIAAGDGSGEWDLTDKAGLPVRGGAYVYLISDGKKTVEGKLKILR